MGAEISTRNINPSSSAQSSIKSKLNFEGIKDYTKSSIFSCICTQSDSSIPAEKSSRLSTQRRSIVKRNSLKSPNSVPETPSSSELNQDRVLISHINTHELVPSIIRPKFNLNKVPESNKKAKGNIPNISDCIEMPVKTNIPASISSKQFESMKSSSFHSQSSVNQSVSSFILKKQLEKSNSSILEINDISEDHPGHLRKDVLIREGDRKYVGDVRDGVPNGYGKEVWPDGSEYEGTYINGVRTGQGIYTWPDKNCYKGSFRNNHMHGFGIFEWNNGNRYEGMWKDSKMHGEGKYIWSNGNRYTGGYAEGLKHGDGVFLYSNGKAVKSTWVNGSIQIDF